MNPAVVAEAPSTDATVEAEIKAKGLTAPRVTCGMLQLPDAELGRLVKHWANKIKVSSEMINRSPYLSAAMLLVEMMTDANAAQMDMTLEECDLGGGSVGDWRIRIERV